MKRGINLRRYVLNVICVHMKIIASLVLLVLTSRALAQGSPAMVNKGDGPVRIVSILSKPTDLLAEVVLHNRGDRSITAVRLGLILAVPSVCGDTPYISRDRTRSFWVDLPKGKDATVKDVQMSPKAVLHLKRLKNASDVLSQLTILKVKYADGSMWTLDRRDRTYDDDLMIKTANGRCVNKSAGG